MGRTCPWCNRAMQYIGVRWQCDCGAVDYGVEGLRVGEDDESAPCVTIIMHPELYINPLESVKSQKEE